MVETIEMVIKMLALYLLLALANTGTGMHYTINVKKGRFHWRKFWDGILNCIIRGISIFIGIICISMLPGLFEQAGISVTNLEDFTLKIAFLIVSSGIVAYAMKFIENLKKIFGETTDEESISELGQQDDGAGDNSLGC
ncbi:MAG: hypothetical protein FWG10_08455 [Eubacteriaceae bacterium]|nr:hypothetical protein [Eubacteriaceae bacterium]